MAKKTAEPTYRISLTIEELDTLTDLIDKQRGKQRDKDEPLRIKLAAAARRWKAEKSKAPKASRRSATLEAELHPDDKKALRLNALQQKRFDAKARAIVKTGR